MPTTVRTRRWSIAAALAACLALAAPVAAATPRDARAFVDSIGVTTHLYYDNTAYGNYAMVKQRLRELGVRHVRDALDPSRRQFFFDRVNDLSANGIKSTLIACDLIGYHAFRIHIDDAKRKVRGALDALEGVNEPDLRRYSGWETNWYQNARGCQYWLRYHARGEEYGPPLTGVPVYGPSATGTTFKQLADLSDRADGGNFHPYPGGRPPSGPDYYPFAQNMADIRSWNFGGRSVPMVATETGYHDAVNCSGCSHYPTSQKAAGIYMPRLFLEYARAGVERTFAHELVDSQPNPERDRSSHNFGLFENDWSYKPSATALKNTIAFLDSPSASPRTPLGYTITNTADPDGAGPRGAVKDLLFQRADRSWWVALWQDSKVWDEQKRVAIDNPATYVRISLDRTLTATGYRPSLGTASQGTVRGTSFTAGTDDDVLLVKLTL